MARGKTPVVVWLAQQLQYAGYSPGIVSRGYGGGRFDSPVLVTDNNAALYGDEPVLLAQLSGCPVCVCRSRAAAVLRVAREGVDVVLSDDGLQHYHMRRNVELVVVDSERGFGNGRLLPAGPLREPVTRLRKVDAVLVNGGGESISGLNFDLEVGLPCRLAGGVERPWSEFGGKRVWCVAGIGNPERFRDNLAEQGLNVDMADVPDHGKVDLEALLAERNQPIFMTQKDAVKYSAAVAADVWVVPANCIFGSNERDALLHLIAAALPASRSQSTKPNIAATINDT